MVSTWDDCSETMAQVVVRHNLKIKDIKKGDVALMFNVRNQVEAEIQRSMPL